MAKEQIETEIRGLGSLDLPRRLGFEGGYAIFEVIDGFKLVSDKDPQMFPDYRRTFSDRWLAQEVAFVISRFCGDGYSEFPSHIQIRDIARAEIQGGKRKRCSFYLKDGNGEFMKIPFRVAKNKQQLLRALDAIFKRTNGH